LCQFEQIGRIILAVQNGKIGGKIDEAQVEKLKE